MTGYTQVNTIELNLIKNRLSFLPGNIRRLPFSRGANSDPETGIHCYLEVDVSKPTIVYLYYLHVTRKFYSLINTHYVDL